MLSGGMGKDMQILRFFEALLLHWKEVCVYRQHSELAQRVTRCACCLRRRSSSAQGTPSRTSRSTCSPGAQPAEEHRERRSGKGARALMTAQSTLPDAPQRYFPLHRARRTIPRGRRRSRNTCGNAGIRKGVYQKVLVALTRPASLATVRRTARSPCAG